MKKNKFEYKDRPFELGEEDFYRSTQIQKHPKDLFWGEEKFSSGLTGEENPDSFKNFPIIKTSPKDHEEFIFKKVNDFLWRNKAIPMEGVIITVVGEVVFLSGHVPEKKIKKRIEKIIRRIPEVKKIVNELIYPSPSPF